MLDHVGHKFDYREFFGNSHFMKQLERSYDFPVSVYQENEDGTRALVRVEHPAA
ncbi:hypothetical protein RGQ21_67840 [Kitasatospora aureofaciens]|nr:hypothetical protein RGQ21_67840 [Kitasatospora aureofaciens]